MTKALLQVQDLNTYFKTDEGLLTAVNGIDFSICRGETLGLVGESGCGKSVSALSIMRLIPEPPGRIVKGRILFEGQDLVRLTESEMRRIRGNAISMIFQEPMTSLNPVHRVGNQIAEAIKLHQNVDQTRARRRAIEMLAKVGIPDPQRRAREYPFQLSGGMRQRVMIAMALSCNPKLIIADEPTTALDVTIQAQILDLMKKLQEDFGAAILLITHDLGVIAEVAERVAVMYAGRIVEMADANPLFAEPMHPYTQGLMASVPHIDRPAAPGKLLETISGMVPSLLNLPPGCTFQDRCERVFERCRSQEPPLIEFGSKHSARCWLYG
jgi:peptide/nickel transport system ATP-binding protein/oligopeptide transport system ATP-binding protein